MSIIHKNSLFLKINTDLILRQEYKKYRNQLAKIIRCTKLKFPKTLLNNLKNKALKLWSHLNTLINPSKNNNIPVDANVLNNFFTSVFNQAPHFQVNQPLTLTDDTFISQTMFLTPVNNNEIINVLKSLSNSNAIGTDGLLPEIIKK